MSTSVEQAAQAVAEVFKKQGQAPRYTVLIAEAVIEALQLTEEWTWSWSETLTLDGKPGYGFSVSSREEAEAESDSYMTIVRRLVGPWRTA